MSSREDEAHIADIHLGLLGGVDAGILVDALQSIDGIVQRIEAVTELLFGVRHRRLAGRQYEAQHQNE